MMTNKAIQFDTHKFVKHLTEVGFSEQQAEVLASEQVDLLNSNLATKTDIEQLRKDTKTDIEQLRLATKTDIEQLRKDTKTDIEKIKVDIEQLRKDTKTDIEQLRKDTKTDIELGLASLKSELLKWMISAMIAQSGVIVGFMAYLN